MQAKAQMDVVWNMFVGQPYFLGVAGEQTEQLAAQPTDLAPNLCCLSKRP